MLLTNDLERVILRNDDLRIAYVETAFLGGDWVARFDMENQVDAVMNDIQSSSITKDPTLDE